MYTGYRINTTLKIQFNYLNSQDAGLNQNVYLQTYVEMLFNYYLVLVSR